MNFNSSNSKSNLTANLETRVNNIEKCFINLNKEFGGYARRTAKLRNNGDEIAKILRAYTTTQDFNSSSKCNIDQFSQKMSVVEDHRDAEFEHLKNHVLEPINHYVNRLKTIKTDIKKEMGARKREMASQQNFLKSSAKPGTIEREAARNDVHMASINAIQQSENLSRRITVMEREKIELMKTVLKSFVHIEMIWHMRALENYTVMYNNVNQIDSLSDLDELCSNIHNIDASLHGTGQLGGMERSASSNSLFNRQPEPMGTNLTRQQFTGSHGDLRNRKQSVQFDPNSPASARHSTTDNNGHSPPHTYGFNTPAVRVNQNNNTHTSVPTTTTAATNQSKPKAVEEPDDDDFDSETDSDEYTNPTTTESPTSRSHNKPTVQPRNK